jgi:hypothetical protein
VSFDDLFFDFTTFTNIYIQCALTNHHRRFPLGVGSCFNIRSVVYYKFPKRNPSVLSFLSSSEIPSLSFRACCNYSQSSPGLSATSHLLDFCFWGVWARNMGAWRCAAGTGWMCICHERRVVAFSSSTSSALSLTRWGRGNVCSVLRP